MAQNSTIEWTDATWNPVTGCTKVSPGCANCYAECMARRLAGRFGYPPAPHHFDVTKRPDRIYDPLKWQKPRMVFVCSMSDLFHKAINWTFIKRVFQTIEQTPRHTYQILTKRASAMNEWGRHHADNILPNVWMGITAEDQQRADERIPHLLNTPAAVRFVSVEPILERVNLDRYLGFVPVKLWPQLTRQGGLDWLESNGPWLDWVIIGCESGPKRRPMHLGWAEELIAHCQAADVPVFVKQLPINGKVSHDPAEWPKSLRVREYPRPRTDNRHKAPSIK